jgi:formylglycine-generating enzyme required for sulfatase activity
VKEVGSFNPNAFGLHDVHGNVWEWVEDCYLNSYAVAPTDGSANTSFGDCSVRVFRGGSFYDYAKHQRFAARGRGGRADANGGGGFRVARTLNP